MSKYISNCAKCGYAIERESLGLMKEKNDNSMPLFHVTIKQINPKTKKFQYNQVLLCDECMEGLWRWIYSDYLTENAESEAL